jgi:hypothetical protein
MVDHGARPSTSRMRSAPQTTSILLQYSRFGMRRQKSAWAHPPLPTSLNHHSPVEGSPTRSIHPPPDRFYTCEALTRLMKGLLLTNTDSRLTMEDGYYSPLERLQDHGRHRSRNRHYCSAAYISLRFDTLPRTLLMSWHQSCSRK